jgi:electron transfer flavoprotein alpha subunit
MSEGRSQGTLLVVVEPEVAADGAGVAALGAETVRLGELLDADVLCVSWAARPRPTLEAVAKALAGQVDDVGPIAVLLLDTDLGRQLAPMVAHRCGGGAVLGCSDALVAGRSGPGGSEHAAAGLRPAFLAPVYGGWLDQEYLPAIDRVVVVTMDLTGVDPADRGASDLLGEPVLLALEDEEQTVRHLETMAPQARSVDLVYARRIVTVGAGAVQEGLLEAAEELADLLEGSVGATRVVTDDGRLPKERLIGQTGRSVAPELYLALGVSGSPHHMAGLRGAGRVIAVDRDVRAPIFQSADVGYVADLKDVLPALLERIRDWRGGVMDG